MLIRNPAVHDRTKLIVRIFLILLPIVLLLPLLSQTVFAQPIKYVITDGNRTTVFITNETNPVDVLAEAGLSLGANDTYTTIPGKDVSEITVQRGQQVMIHYCGQSIQAYCFGENLKELLNRLDLPVYSNYAVSHSLDTLTYHGMEITIDNIVQQEQTYTEELPFETIFCYDPTMPKDTQKVQVAGVPGQVRYTANVVYVNTVEKSRTILTQTVIRQPVNQIVVVGTGEQVDTNSKMPAIGNGIIVTASGEILTYSHSDQFKTTAYTHTDPGCDMITATGTTVRVGTVAVDPKVVPYGTRMFILTNDGQYIYGIATAEDCGGAIKGKHIDLYFPTDPECWTFGIRSATVYFLT